MKPVLLVALVIAALAITAASASADGVTMSDGGTSVPEGGTAHFIVTTSYVVLAQSEPTFNVSLSDGTAVSGADYGSLPSPAVSSDACLGTCTTQYTYDIAIPQDNIHEGNETFQAGVGYTTSSGGGSGATQFTIVDDNVTEPTENYLVNLTAPAGTTAGDLQGEGKIIDNDAPPSISVEAKKVTEGNAGTTDAKFELELSHPSAFPIDVSYHTEDGTAHSPDDYQAKSGTVHFEPMQKIGRASCRERV